MLVLSHPNGISALLTLTHTALNMQENFLLLCHKADF